MPSGKQLEEWTAGFDLEELVEAGKRGKKRAAARQEKYESVFIARAMKRRKANADDPDAELVIKRIKSQRETAEGVEYLVSWEGFDSDEDTWEPEASLRTEAGEPTDALEEHLSLQQE